MIAQCRHARRPGAEGSGRGDVYGLSTVLRSDITASVSVTHASLPDGSDALAQRVKSAHRD
jgi:hypothetical protein